MRFSLAVYRLLLRLYPARFRENFAGPLERQFRDELAEAPRLPDLARLWLRTFADFVTSAPVQIAREVRQDARHALRLWARRPVHTAFAVAALAIGIGANTGVFSVLNSLLLRSLPFRDPERLASLRMFSPVGLDRSDGDFHAWRSRSAYLEDGARYVTSEVNVGGAREAARIRLTETSANFFAMLGSTPLLGRAFADGEDKPGRETVAVIGYGFWRQLYGGDPGVLGATIRLNGTPLTIVGVAAPDFDYPQRTSVWTPTTFDWGRIPKTGVNFVETIGRLKPWLTWAQARQAFEAEAFSAAPRRRNADAANRPALEALRDQLAGPLKQASLILMGGVALILLIACLNVANLMLARAIDRANELAIRGALGASRGRLTQQLLTESVLLSAIAAVAGLAIAVWSARVAAAAQPAPLASQDYTVLDWRVLLFTMAISLATGILFGVIPAWRAGRGAPTPVRAAGWSPRASRLRHFLIGLQVALTIVFLTSSVALGRAFLGLLRVDNGYGVHGIVTLSISLAGSEHQPEPRAAAYWREALDRVRRTAGVESASATEFLPLGVNMFMGGRFTIDGRGEPAFATMVPIAPEYFRAMGGRVLYGREFESRDAGAPEPVAIVSEELARRFGSPRDALGGLLTAGRFKPRRIVGVVQGQRYGGPTATVDPLVFTLSASPTFMTIVARVPGNPRGALPAIRDAVQSVDPRLPIFNVKTMEERLAEALARPRFYATAMLFFGGFAALLALIGVYGVVSYAALQQRREMGIRLALGATPRRLRASLLTRSMMTVAAGLAPGIAGAIVARRYLETLIGGAAAVTPNTSILTGGAIAGIAAAAAWFATRQIARLDIAEVVRAD